MAALPAVPFGGVEDEGRQQYLDALQQVMASLQARQQPNLFSIAGALLDPGRTGGAGEAMGRAATELGRQQAQQEQQMPGIAMMRAQIAAQKYEIGNQGKALQLMAGTLGIPVTDMQQQLQSGSLTPASMNRLAQIYPAVAQLSPKVGEILKGTFNMQNELTKQAQEDRKSGFTEAELVAKYGPGVKDLIPGYKPTPPSVDASQPQHQPQPQPQPAMGGALPSAVQPSAPAQPIGPLSAAAQPAQPAQPTQPAQPSSAMPGPAQPAPAQPSSAMPGPAEIAQLQQRNQQLRQQISATDPSDTQTLSTLNTELDSVQKMLMRLGVKTPPISQAQPSPAKPPSDVSGLPLAAQAEISKKRVEEGDKPYLNMRDAIVNYTPQLLESSNTNLRQLDYFARNKPQIFALMQQQGLLAGLMTAAQEGAQLTAGDFHARLGLPVKQFLERVKLSPEDQQSVRDVTRILGSEFLSNVKANKGLLGVNPTDNDARLLQAPMASTEDSAKAMQHWARQQILLNKQREALYGAWSQYTDQSGAAASPRNFFRPGSPYEKINKDYADYRMQLFKQFHPGE